jgi:hypothetical protein
MPFRSNTSHSSRKASTASLLIVAAISILCELREASAQSLSLPSIDKINVFVHGGRLLGSDDLFSNKTLDIGWGFETIFQLKELEVDRVIELAVGYDDLFMSASLGGRYQARGSIRSLPSISIYFSTFYNFYAGVGTGITSMTNVFVYDNTRRIASLKGDTFDLAGTLGYIVPMGRVALFLEAGYHTRYLGGVSYGDHERPMDIAGLPRSLYFGGFSLALGFQLDLTPRKE